MIHFLKSQTSNVSTTSYEGVNEGTVEHRVLETIALYNVQLMVLALMSMLTM